MHNGAELIIDDPLNTRASRFMGTLAIRAPSQVRAVRRYTGDFRVIVVYGPGRPSRQEYIARHLAKGGRALLWDMAYWDRVDSMRLSLDGLHPTAEHLELYDGHARRAFELREDAQPEGPIMLVGLGAKTNVALGHGEFTWERKALKMIRERWPGKEVLWRPKGAIPQRFEGLRISHGTPITEALRGCAAVVCRHSNVAVDACVAGVPVFCEDGAAFALYRDNPQPSREQRAKFLAKLSWWEWSRADAQQAWLRMASLIESTGGGFV